ncbi:MAG: UDP-glucose 4-epimerase GalE [Chlamydiales bacterium]|nr:UDP-glucose 4-epimerase GalE [Chlamydiia bacterium]MCP5507585.1 UDP-glucose 4-epimerase GalE [Chlamydiales bacterium]
MSKCVLVVGGAGFIGSYVNKMLDDSGYATIVLDNLSRGSRKAVTRGTFVEGDMADTPLLDKLFTDNQIDAVMHFAAYIDVGESVRDPDLYYHNNVVNTINLLNAMRRHGVKKFIFSSSAAVYGLPDCKYISESHPCNPINPYGESKLMVEKILYDYDNAYDLKYSSLRYFNAAGGDPDGEVLNYRSSESNLIPIVLRSLTVSDGQVTIFGTDYPTPDGTCIRDYIHIHDLGTAHILSMEKLFQGGMSSTYNLGNSEGFSVRDVIAAAERVTQQTVNVIEGARRAGDPPYLVASAEKAKRELNWEPRYRDLDTIVADAWRGLEPVRNRDMCGK